jgi:hypothetical protein
MGRSSTPKYVIEFVTGNGRQRTHEWRVRTSYRGKGYGRPTEANLEKHVQAYNASVEPGGCNAHLGPKATAVAAVIKLNVPGGEELVSWVAPVAPLFELAEFF